jgi:hypothetical protein
MVLKGPAEVLPLKTSRVRADKVREVKVPTPTLVKHSPRWLLGSLLMETTSRQPIRAGILIVPLKVGHDMVQLSHTTFSTRDASYE